MIIKYRRGQAGNGKYYTQIHGDVKYNRRKNKIDSEKEIEAYISDTENKTQRLFSSKKDSLEEKIEK